MRNISYISPDIVLLEILSEGIICDSVYASDSEDIVLFGDQTAI